MSVSSNYTVKEVGIEDEYMSKNIWSLESKFWSDISSQNPLSWSFVTPLSGSSILRLANASNSSPANSLLSAMPAKYKTESQSVSVTVSFKLKSHVIAVKLVLSLQQIEQNYVIHSCSHFVFLSQNANTFDYIDYRNKTNFSPILLVSPNNIINLSASLSIISMSTIINPVLFSLPTTLSLNFQSSLILFFNFILITTSRIIYHVLTMS